MLRRIRKIPFYALKLIRDTTPFELFEIVKHTQLGYIFKAILGRLKREPTHVIFKNFQKQEINFFLDLLKHRKKKKTNEIYLWDYQGEHLYASHTQFLGLHSEYLKGTFEKIYQVDCFDKMILDVGGFVGDSALYFLRKGARKVILYEPIEINLQAMNYNLQSYKDKIEVHQKALAKENGLLTIFSSEPIGDMGFGSKEGRYCMECEGITMTSILKKHPQIDIAKIDCEGGEEYLLHTPNEEIRSIPYWIIETHSKQLSTTILKKFQENLFQKTFETHLAPEVHLFHFQLEKECS